MPSKPEMPEPTPSDLILAYLSNLNELVEYHEKMIHVKHEEIRRSYGHPRVSIKVTEIKDEIDLHERGVAALKFAFSVLYSQVYAKSKRKA